MDFKFLCSYGCGQEAKYYVTKKSKLCCSPKYLNCPEIRKKNSEGLKKSYNNGVRKSAKEVYKNLPQKTKDKMQWNKGKHFWNDERIKSKFNIIDLFSYTPSARNSIRKLILIEERGYKCEDCNNVTWNNKPITLELEHIDGDTKNNIKENLKLLCPNCHSQTETWKKGKGYKEKISDQKFIDALKIHKNISQTLLSLGLTNKGANYVRAYKLLAFI